MAGRDDFTAATKRKVAESVAYFCSHPNCGRLTIGLSSDRASGVTMIGVAAHIAAAAKGGERYDASLTPQQRKAPANGIWMCAIHAKWIDDNASIATVEKLREWKAAQEAEIAAWVEHGHPGIFKSWDRLAALTKDQRDSIETCLPNGHTVVRDRAALIGALTAPGFTPVNGDSGVGKSALVKAALDEHFSDARQIWLGPEALQAALSEASREALGLTAPLLDLLRTTTAAQNILVLDAVERVDTTTINRLGHVVRSLTDGQDPGAKPWHVVAISQRAGFEVHLDPLVNGLSHTAVDIPPIGLQSVHAALLSVPALAQHAFDNAFLTLLGNLRTLAWIIAAGPALDGSGTRSIATRPQIADRLWAHWTGDDADLHSLLIALAKRDADYERSFALSALDPANRAAWKAGRQRLPIVLDSRSRLSFEHDLASDWARYQSLKEIADDVTQWAALANQPLWVAALRLFGQYLLREADQAANGWDWAFAAAQTAGAPDAIDILLDALCLDPAADHYLTTRADLLFANDGKLLNRLLARFMHIATLPEVSTATASASASVGLYAEAEMRAPIWGDWPPLIRFLVSHRATIAPFASRMVAKFCRMWLTKAPTHVNGSPVLGREGLTALAIETARVDQIESIVHAFYGGRSDDAGNVFAAALAGAEDHPEPVGAFALEMARRRPLAESSQARIDALRAEEQARREETAKQRPKRRAAAPESMSMFGYRKLPPWPLGPAGRLNDAFRNAVLRDGALSPLMKSAPEVAAEILLACIIDDSPHTEPSAMTFDERLGLHWEHDDRPTLFWTSPFFLFLAEAPVAALDALLKLVDFCTERWAESEYHKDAQPLELVVADGSIRKFLGNWQVFDWSHTRRAVNSQLYSALDALERWLWMKIKAGEDVSVLCADLLARTNSVAILGVLADCAKLDPPLLDGALAPLLVSPSLVFWDEYRLSQRFGNDVFTWHRAGEAARTFGLEWEQAAHRISPLKYSIRDRRRADPVFNVAATRAILAWPPIEGAMELRCRALAAELDPTNWHEVQNADGQTEWSFRYPPEIAAEIEASQPEVEQTVTIGMVLKQLEQLLRSNLSAAEAADLFGSLDDTEGLAHFSPPEKRIIQTAIATVLVVRGGDWLSSDPGILERLCGAIDASVPAFEDIEDPLDERLDYGPGLLWAAIGALFAKVYRLGTAQRWDRILSFGLATGEPSIVKTIVAATRDLRGELGTAYRAIVEAAVFGATLNALLPRMDGEPGSLASMARWRQRLARRPLSISKCLTEFDLVSLAQRVERLWLSRYRRLTGEEISPDSMQRLHRRYSFGIASNLLMATFDWALQHEIDPPVEDLADHRNAIQMIWRFVEWRLRDHPDESIGEYGGYDRLDDVGLDVVRTIAARIPMGNAAESCVLWEPVLALGPRGEFTLEHMIDLYFLRLYKSVDAANFIANWNAMLAFISTPGWVDGGKYWYGRSIFRHMLGIDAAHQIASNPAVLSHVKNLAPAYEAFAKEHLPHDDRTLASFASFFASTAGAELRLEAIQWIEAVIAEKQSKLSGDAGAALGELTQILLADHSAALIANREARRALNTVIGRMVRDQAPYALALQDRARALR